MSIAIGTTVGQFVPLQFGGVLLRLAIVTFVLSAVAEAGRRFPITLEFP